MRCAILVLTRFYALLVIAMFSEAKADRAVKFFESLKHTKGEFSGKPFILLDWEKKIIRDVYGTLKDDGTRQYKYIYIEIPKKQGKSEIAAGFALYQLFADGEANGEVYGCAADKDQASLVFDVAVDMVDQVPALKKRVHMNLSTKKITDRVSKSFYKVVSAEAYCMHPDVRLDSANGQQKLAKDIVLGDMVMGWDGQSLAVGRVTQVWKQPETPIYKINTHRGREIKVTGEHQFLTMTTGRRPQDQTHSFEWIKAKDLKPGSRVRIGLGWSGVINSGDTEEAWALGAWEGDGECGRFRFTNIDPEIVSRLRGFFEGMGSALFSRHSTRQFENGKEAQYPIEHAVMGVGKRRKSPGREWIRTHFGQIARSHTKVVPDIIWRGGFSVWSAFLAGYLDADGCIPNQTPCVRWGSASQELLQSCQTLLQRLGINGSLTNGLLTVSGRGQLALLYDALSPHMALTRKKEQLLTWVKQPYEFNFKAHTTDRVVSINVEDPAETISIEVDSIDTHITNGIITHNTKHGLNLSACVFDELHAQPGRDLWDVMTFGAGDARRQPLWVIITTAGEDPDRVSIGWEEHEYASKILAGEIVDPTWYVVIYGYEGDDIYNEDNWYKANPSLGTTIKIESVREAAEKAKVKPAEERLFRWLRLNQWILTKLTTWQPVSLFDSAVGEWARDEQLGKDCYLGLDLSTTTDLSALAVIFPPQGKQYDWRVFWKAWIPEVNMLERIRKDHVPYDVWARDKWITVTPGDVVDYTVIRDDILEIKKFYKIQELDADRAFATMLLQELEAEGISCVDVPQTFVSLTDPLNQTEILLKGKKEVDGEIPKALSGSLLTGRMTHEANPAARWCFGNTSIATNGQGFIKYVKEHRGKSVVRTKRIDLVASWITGMARARFYKGNLDLSAKILADDWGM